MAYIIPAILCLIQHLKLIKNNHERFRLEVCPECGKATPWFHGTYPRKSDREPGEEGFLNPIPIQRFYCPDCRHTSSALPECIPPHRWYLWKTQQVALFLCLSGHHSVRDVSKKITPSRHTITRWVKRFKTQFPFHKNALSTHDADLGRRANFSSFWHDALSKFSLGEAMRLCHVFGEVIV